MESQADYSIISRRDKSPLLAVTTAVCILLSTTLISSYSYNPLAISFSSSLGCWIFSICYLLYSKIIVKSASNLMLPNPYATGVLLGLCQLALPIAYYYNPVNHGEVSILIGMSVIFPFVIAKSLHAIQYIGLLAVLSGLGVTIYYSYLLWLLYSIYYALAAVVLFTIFLALSRTGISEIEYFISTTVTFAVNVVAFGFFMLLGLFPLDNESTLIYLGIIAGIILAFGLHLAAINENQNMTLIALLAVGFIQVFVDKFVFGFSILGQLFLPTLPIFIGLEIFVGFDLIKSSRISKD